MNRRSGRQFTITRIEPSRPTPTDHKPVGSTNPFKKTAEDKLPPPREPVETGGLFGQIDVMLQFLGSVLNSEIATGARVHRLPDQRLWAVVDGDYTRVGPIVWQSKGRPYTWHQRQWVPLTLDSNLPTEPFRALNVDEETIVDLAELLGETPLHRSHYTPSDGIEVISPAPVAQIILRRAAMRQLNVTVLPVQVNPLTATGTNSNALLLRIRHPRGEVIPASLVHSLTDLPYVLVSGSHNTVLPRVLVDVRVHAPLPPQFIESMVPVNEIWALGPVETGRWRLRYEDQPFEAVSLAGEVDVPPVNISPYPSGLIEHLPVQLIQRRQHNDPIDGVLLDDDELGWLKRYLLTRPANDASFLMLGSGQHLFLAPTNLSSILPFGLPVTHIGPHALFRQAGQAFFPPLSVGARQKQFDLNDEVTVVVTPKAAFRFERRTMVPAWTLWVGEVPPVHRTLSPKAQQILGMLEYQLRELEIQRIKEREKQMQRPDPVTDVERAALLQAAQEDKLNGRYQAAAEKLERAGYHAEAGRLYERAAQELG